MADWVTISSLATAGGTLVLAVATFSSVRSANRSARVAELSLLAGVRPVLIPSRDDDPDERVHFIDEHILRVPGHGGLVELSDGNLYFAMALRNGGTGLAVLHGWRAEPLSRESNPPAPKLEDFRRQTRDLYIPAGDIGFWQGAIRDSADPSFEPVRRAVESGASVTVDLLYGDYEGGQRTIARFTVGFNGDDHRARAEVARYWNVDRPDPR